MCATVALMLTGTASAAPAPPSLPEDLDLIPRDALAFQTIAVGDLWRNEFIQKTVVETGKEHLQLIALIHKATGLEPADISRVTIVFLVPPGQDEPRERPALVILLAKPCDINKVVLVLGPRSKKALRGGRTYHVSEDGALYPVSDRLFIIGQRRAVELMMDRANEKKEGSRSAALSLAATGKHHIVWGNDVAPYQRILIDYCPDPVGKQFPPLLKAKAMTQTGDFGKEIRLTISLAFDKEEEAKEAISSVKALVAMVQFNLGTTGLNMDCGKPELLLALFKDLLARLKNLAIEQHGATLQGSAVIKVDMETAVVSMINARSKNNMKNLVLAMIKHSEKNTGAFPPAAIADKTGKPLLSWRVAILPYLEENDLYQQFKLDEPWDSPNNKKLLSKMPKFFLRPGADPKSTTTHYRVFVGKGAAFEGTKSHSSDDLTHGLSDTIVIVEAADAVEWTKPDELPFQPDKPLPKLGFGMGESFNVAVADGSVRSLPKKIDPKVLRLLLMPNSGEAKNWHD